MWFAIIISFLILQRLAELIIARRNEQWLRNKGAVEYGKAHYPWMVALHTGFILSIIGEYLFYKPQADIIFLVLWIILILIKVWVICSLGKYWNTKILRIPGSIPVQQGLYKYIRHPNYVIVIGEIFIIPMIFHLYVTAITFSILNAWMLSVRIKEENSVWRN
jgi:methyltransferase